MTPPKKKTLYEIPRWPRCHYHVHSLRKALHRILLLYFGPHTSASPSPRTRGRCVFVNRRNVIHGFIRKEDLFIPSVSRTSYTPSVIPNTKKKEKKKRETCHVYVGERMLRPNFSNFSAYTLRAMTP